MEAVLRMDVQYVLHAAGILSSFNCYSPEKFVIDDELLSALRAATRADRRRRRDAGSGRGGGRADPAAHAGSGTHPAARARRPPRASIMNRDPVPRPGAASGGRDLAEMAARRVAELARRLLGRRTTSTRWSGASSTPTASVESRRRAPRRRPAPAIRRGEHLLEDAVGVREVQLRGRWRAGWRGRRSPPRATG